VTVNLNYWPSALNAHARSPMPTASSTIPVAKATAPARIVTASRAARGGRPAGVRYG
jgi:hypothetical protein